VLPGPSCLLPSPACLRGCAAPRSWTFMCALLHVHDPPFLHAHAHMNDWSVMPAARKGGLLRRHNLQQERHVRKLRGLARGVLWGGWWPTHSHTHTERDLLLPSNLVVHLQPSSARVLIPTTMFTRPPGLSHTHRTAGQPQSTLTDLFIGCSGVVAMAWLSTGTRLYCGRALAGRMRGVALHSVWSRTHCAFGTAGFRTAGAVCWGAQVLCLGPQVKWLGSQGCSSPFE